jgi:hypothetical protein
MPLSRPLASRPGPPPGLLHQLRGTATERPSSHRSAIPPASPAPCQLSPHGQASLGICCWRAGSVPPPTRKRYNLHRGGRTLRATAGSGRGEAGRLGALGGDGLAETRSCLQAPRQSTRRLPSRVAAGVPEPASNPQQLCRRDLRRSIDRLIHWFQCESPSGRYADLALQPQQAAPKRCVASLHVCRLEFTSRIFGMP